MPAQATPQESCRDLRQLTYPGGYVTWASIIPSKGDIPAHCEIRATALPALSLVIHLPLEFWSGYYYQTGCDSLCSVLDRSKGITDIEGLLAPALARGHAVAAPEIGGPVLSVVGNYLPPSLLAANPDATVAEIAATHRIANLAIEAFYGRSADWRVFEGQSSGGRLALLAAQRLPTAFDGIIAGAPALDATGSLAVDMAWLDRTNSDPTGRQLLGPKEAALIGQAVMDQCDTLDGFADNLISDPRQCQVDYSDLALSPLQQDALDKWRRGPLGADGTPIYSGGVPVGSEAFWPLWLTGDSAGAPPVIKDIVGSYAQASSLTDGVDEAWKLGALTVDKPTNAIVSGSGAATDSLSEFRAAGGRLILYHGWADSVVSPYRTLQWYDDEIAKAGGAEALEAHVALFLVPGLDHCSDTAPLPGGGTGILEPLSALEHWLAEDHRPRSIFAP